jgi:hypothetical protein
MKTNAVIVVIISILFTSCNPAMPTQEIDATNHVPTAVSITKVPMTAELVVTEELIATAAPTQTPVSCVTLLTPLNDTELPAMGKITFSWSPVNEATFYVLSVMPASGGAVTFETQQTFREQYVEVFWAAGNYQWSVVAQDRKRNEICSSALATFSKPASPQPEPARNDDRKKN